MNPNVNPVYGYNCYNIANNQFLMWNKDLIKRDVEKQGNSLEKWSRRPTSCYILT